MLTKSLVKVGNSYAIVLDRTLMDLVGMSPEVPVNIQVNGLDLAQNDDLFEALTLSVAKGDLGKEQVGDMLRRAALA